MSLHIPNPCHEDWNQMNPEGNGRFCGSCSKIVVDFTVMSDEEVRNYLLQHRGQHTCGRFYNKQLTPPLQQETLSLPRAWFAQLPRSRQIFYAVALFFMVGISSCSFSDTPTDKHLPSITGITVIPDTTAPVTDTLPTPKPSTEKLMGEPAPAQTSGIVAEEPITMGPPPDLPEPPQVMAGTVAPPVPPGPPEIMGKIAAPPISPPATPPQNSLEPVMKGDVQLKE